MGARSKARKRAVDILFESDLRGLDPLVLLAERVGAPELPPVSEYTISLVHGVVEHGDDIDQLLADQAHGWALARMPAVDRAVLRLGVFELLFSDEVDDAVAIDEAIELAKLLSTDDSPRFVNGVLGALAALPRGL
ncbi:MAG: transcription antitermination factor NusB [Pseudonocardiales bacterium]|nr:transcription antitermination factor NusB [Pseudonocardiales bacterium]MBV9730461.1 transcription antitermination factor NusB [Pseudonocardiales bacterium]